MKDKGNGESEDEGKGKINVVPFVMRYWSKVKGKFAQRISGKEILWDSSRFYAGRKEMY